MTVEAMATAWGLGCPRRGCHLRAGACAATAPRTPNVASMRPRTTRGGDHGSGSTSVLRQQGRGNATKLMDQWASCMRANGDPNQTDPTIDQYGVINITIPDGVSATLSGQVHGSTVRAVRTWRQKTVLRTANPVAPPPSQAQLLQYVDCMRTHGVPNYPYPGNARLTSEVPAWIRTARRLRMPTRFAARRSSCRRGGSPARDRPATSLLRRWEGPNGPTGTHPPAGGHPAPGSGEAYRRAGWLSSRRRVVAFGHRRRPGRRRGGRRGGRVHERQRRQFGVVIGGQQLGQHRSGGADHACHVGARGWLHRFRRFLRHCRAVGARAPRRSLRTRRRSLRTRRTSLPTSKPKPTVRRRTTRRSQRPRAAPSPRSPA